MTRAPQKFRHRRIAIVAAMCLPLYSPSMAVADDDKEVESKVASVALFKNGLAVVRRQVTLPAAGVVRVSDVPEPVHGTFFVESNGPLEARVEKRRIAIKNQPKLGRNLQDDLAGSISLSTGSAQVDYERIVQWTMR